MQVYTMEIRERTLSLASDDGTLVRTSSNVDIFEFLFYDAEWLGYDLFCALAVDGVLVHEKHIDVMEMPHLLSDVQEEPVGEPDASGESDGSGDSDDDEQEYIPDDGDIGVSDGGEGIDEPTEEAVEWIARTYVVVPDEVLEHEGALGVTVHGFGEGGEHVITALSVPLEIRHEGDVAGDAPSQSPYGG